MPTDITIVRSYRPKPTLRTLLRLRWSLWWARQRRRAFRAYVLALVAIGEGIAGHLQRVVKGRAR